MKSGPTPRLFFDRDLGWRLPESLRLMGVDVQAHRERYPSESTSVKDDDWIPVVTQDGYAIVTHDARIRRRQGEWDVYLAAGAKCFVLATNRPHRFTHLRALMLAWDAVVAKIAAEEPPFMYGLDAKGQLRRYGGPKLVDSDSPAE